MKIKIIIISDTHELHREIRIPACDFLFHAGDFSFFGRNAAAIDDFNIWLGEQPARHRIITPGNHEFPIEADPDKWRKRLSNATILINEGVEIEGVRIWGSPTTVHYGGAFGVSSEADRENLYASIPEVTDILMTHGPPLGILDAGQGCGALRRAVVRVRPRLHCFGHAHNAYGTRATKRTMFVNAALLDEDGAPSRRPIVIEVATIV